MSNTNKLLRQITAQRDIAIDRADRAEAERDAALRERLAQQQAPAVPTVDAPSEREKRRERLMRWQRPARAGYVQFVQRTLKLARLVQQSLADLAERADATGEDNRALAIELGSMAEKLYEWAESPVVGQYVDGAVRTMLKDVNQRNFTAWMAHSREMGVALRQELQDTPLGATFAAIRETQTVEIKSIPIGVAAELKDLASEALVTGERTSEIQARLRELAGSDLLPDRARMLARTVVGAASEALTRARAERVGSTHYVWHCHMTAESRPEHRKLNGTIQRWDSPPIAGKNGWRAHPGESANCSCWSEVLLPERE